MLPALYFALQHNDIRFIQEIRIENNQEKSLDGFESAVQSALSRKLIEIGQNEKYRLTAEGIAYVEEAKKKSTE